MEMKTDMKAGIGHNSGAKDEAPEILDERALTPQLQRYKALYRRAEQDVKDASDRMAEEKKYFKAQQADVFEAIESIRLSALEKMQTKLRERPDYVDAEAAKKEAQEARKEIVAEMKAAGLDVQTFKAVLKLEKYDPFERRELFDRYDIYAKCLRLWEGADDI